MTTATSHLRSGSRGGYPPPLKLRSFDGVVCFGGEDWWYHNHGHYDLQMMRRFAMHVPVLYVNSLGMRIPRPGEGKMFLRRIRRKLQSMQRGMVLVDDRMSVFSPFVLPGRAGMSMTRPALTSLVRSAARRQRISRPLVWVNCPTGAEAVEALDPIAVVYQRTDRYECFKGVDTDRVREYDRWLKARADLTVFCSCHLFEFERGDCRRACYVDHGVDYARFASAAGEGPDPDDLAALPHPRVGFIGGIDTHTFDPDLLKDVARLLPEAQFVLVGSCSLREGWCDLPNVHLLGQKPYEEVPRYMTGCDVLIMPWNRSRWVEACNPVKLKEYLAVGKPVVSTDFPELRNYEGLVSIADDATSFAKAIRSALSAPHNAQPGRERIRQENWETKAGIILGELAGRGILPAFDPAKTQHAAAPETSSHSREDDATGAIGSLIVEPRLGCHRLIASSPSVLASELISSCNVISQGNSPRLRQTRDQAIREPAPWPTSIKVGLEACIILGGGLRPSPLVAATGRNILDLWLTPDRTVLDCWTQRIDEMGVTPRPQIRVVHDSSQPPPWPRTGAITGLIIEKEPKSLRGPAGIVRDLCVDYSRDSHVLIVEAARYLCVPLNRMIWEHFERGADVTIASCEDDSPAGVYLLRCGTLDLVPSVGFMDLKEQWLRRVLDAAQKVNVHELIGHGSLPLWTRRQFLTAAQAANNVEPDLTDGSGLAGGLLTSGQRSGVQVVCPGAVIGPGCTIVDSVVMPGSVVGPKSIVVRSLICPDSRIQAGADIADAVVYAGECLSDDRRACA